MPRPLSLHPLKFDEVIADVLKIKPEPKPPAKPKAKVPAKAKRRNRKAASSAK